MKKIASFVVCALISLGIISRAFAERDWEYWSQTTFTFPVNKKVSFLLIPEWRFKEDMHNLYLFKLETAPSFKINEYLEIAPYYVYQEKKSGSVWDRSDLMYLDGTLKLSFRKLFDIKLSNRLRYQYDFDKDKTTLRNAAKISKSFKIGKYEITPYLGEEPFYDAKLNRITEHRSSTGVSYSFSKNASLSLGYMVNSKKARSKWSYTNVLVLSLNIKF